MTTYVNVYKYIPLGLSIINRTIRDYYKANKLMFFNRLMILV